MKPLRILRGGASSGRIVTPSPATRIHRPPQPLSAAEARADVLAAHLGACPICLMHRAGIAFPRIVHHLQRGGSAEAVTVGQVAAVVAEHRRLMGAHAEALKVASWRGELRADEAEAQP